MSQPTPPTGQPAPSHDLQWRVMGLGSAGCRAVEAFARAGLPAARLLALNTDIPALLRTPLDNVIPLGARLTRGLGTGSDPELGRAAAEDEADMLAKLCVGLDVVFIVAGLGGGLGTGASPVVARVAREAGARVVAVVTLPFECEGTRRQAQAAQGLAELSAVADAVLCLPNQRVLGLVTEQTSLVDTFDLLNDLLARGVCGLTRLLTRQGLINVDFSDLCAAVRGRPGETLFATAEAEGADRVAEAAHRLFAHPLLEGGRLLGEASSILVSVAGGPELTLAEVSRIMKLLDGASPEATSLMGAVIDPAMAGRLSITLVASRAAAGPSETPRRQVRVAEAAPAAASEGDEATPAEDPVSETRPEFLQAQSGSRPASRFVAPPPELTSEQKEEALRQGGARIGRKQKVRMRQGVLPLEIVSKGRFERSEPTVYQGEDLDVPTYIRRGVPLN